MFIGHAEKLQIISVCIAAWVGVCSGSFLNVVVHRLPIMTERRQRRAAGMLAESSTQVEDPFNLAVPRSRCPTCGHQIRWFENIPVLSYVALGGRCSSCHTHISLRYPMVEVVTSTFFAFCIWRFGATPTGVAWCFFGAMLLSLVLIDWDANLSPDAMTMSLLGVGICASALGITQLSVADALTGAVGGFLLFCMAFWAGRLTRTTAGLRAGDVKLMAAVGAWLGWQALGPLVLIKTLARAIRALSTHRN